MKKAVAGVRAGNGPAFIESRITRWPGNAGSFPALKGGDFNFDWAFKPKQGPEELRDWLANSDPVSLYARALVKAKAMTRKQIDAMDAEIVAAVEEAAKFAMASPPRKAESALEHVFA